MKAFLSLLTWSCALVALTEADHLRHDHHRQHGLRRTNTTHMVPQYYHPSQRDLQDTTTTTTTTSWVTLGAAVTGAAANDQAGRDVSMSADGTRLAVSSPNYDSTNQANAGQVRVLEYSVSAQQWVLLGNTAILGETAGEMIGETVVLSGDGTTVAIGSTKQFPYKGFVRIYRYNAGTKVWTKLGGDLVGVTDRDRFGAAIAMTYNGDRVAIGAPFHDGDDQIRGHTRIFDYISAGNTWIKVGKDLDGVREGDKSGTSVALSRDGTIVAVGAPTSNVNGAGMRNSGTVTVYQRTSSLEDWVMMGSVIPGTVQNEQSGHSVALSDDGSVVAIGR